MIADRPGLSRLPSTLEPKHVSLLLPGEGEERVLSRHQIYPTTSVLDLIRETTIEYPNHFVVDVGGQLYPGGAKVYDAVEEDATVFVIPDQARVG
jgi:hypothetical protein